MGLHSGYSRLSGRNGAVFFPVERSHGQTRGSPRSGCSRCSPAVRTISKDSSLHPSIFSLIKNYVGTVTNAGRLDFSSHVPQEVEIRMEGLSIGLSPSLAVFNFRTKYGFSMQTSRKPDASDRAIYQWMKNRMKAEKREK